MRITKITKVDEPLKVYDFTVDTDHHYILDNGIVSHNSYVPTKTASGGGGAMYASSLVLDLSKKKDKDGTDVIGNIIKVKIEKSRYSRESQQVELKLNFKTGLDKYYGLLDIAEKAGIFKKVSTRYELPDGSKHFGKTINENPEQFYTPEIMEQIEKYVNKNFVLGSGTFDENTESDIEESGGE